MKITITSASGNLLSHESFESISLMTESGEITILPRHQPLLSVVRPGVMTVKYILDKNLKTEEYITGGGVVTISSDEVIIVIDSIDNVEDLDNAEQIEQRKQEAEEIMREYQDENAGNIDPKRAMELEHQYLKYAAMQELIKNSSLRSGRK